MWNARAGSLFIKSIPVNSIGWFTPASSENHFMRRVLKAQTNFRAVSLVFLFLFSFLLLLLQLMRFHWWICCQCGTSSQCLKAKEENQQRQLQSSPFSKESGPSKFCWMLGCLQQPWQVHQWGQRCCWKAVRSRLALVPEEKTWDASQMPTGTLHLSITADKPGEANHSSLSVCNTLSLQCHWD